MESSPACIERTTWIAAPRERVWRVLSDVHQFCRWFGCDTSALAFTPGVPVRMVAHYPTPADDLVFYMDIEDVVPPERFTWRWHPGANFEGEDLSQEPKTLVTFRLEEADNGTRVTVVETGFDQIFAHRRAAAYKDNVGGWEAQMVALERYCAARN